MKTRRSILFGIPLLLAACAATGPVKDATTTVIMVRHADRAGEILNATGIARAAALPGALADYELDAIYSPDIGRNLETAEPLSRATGLPVTVITKESAAQRMTQDHPDGTVIWIGNKGNLISIWNELGAPGDAPQQYGDIGVISLQGGATPTVSRLTVTP